MWTCGRVPVKCMVGCVCVLLPSSPSHNSLSGMDFPVAFRLALAFSNIGLWILEPAKGGGGGLTKLSQTDQFRLPSHHTDGKGV